MVTIPAEWGVHLKHWYCSCAFMMMIIITMITVIVTIVIRIISDLRN